MMKTRWKLILFVGFALATRVLVAMGAHKPPKTEAMQEAVAGQSAFLMKN